MHLQRAFLTGLVTLGLNAIAHSASAVTFESLPGFTDSAFQQLVGSGNFAEAFTVESQFGDSALDGDRELGISVAGNAVAQGQQRWLNGQTYNFVLEYTGTQVRYTVTDTTLTANLTGAVTDLYLRTAAEDDAGVFLDTLNLNGTILLSQFSQAGEESIDIDYVRIGDLAAPFMLTGQQKFNWVTDGTLPTDTASYQITAGQSIPTPALLPGLIGLAAAAYRRSRAKQKPDSHSPSDCH
jgi:hypothetical protein